MTRVLNSKLKNEIGRYERRVNEEAFVQGRSKLIKSDEAIWTDMVIYASIVKPCCSKTRLAQ